MRLKSNLNRKRVELIPEVYHRQQGGSGVYSGRYLNEKGKFKPPNIKKGERMKDIVSKTYENPAVNSLRAFEPIPNTLETSIFLASRFIVRLNHKHRRDATEVDRARDAFRQHLRGCNICYKCRRPFKTERGIHQKRKITSHLKIGGFESVPRYKYRSAGTMPFADIQSHCELASLPKLDENGKVIGSRNGYVIVCEPNADEQPYYIESVIDKRVGRIHKRVFNVYLRGTGEFIQTLESVPSEYRIFTGDKCQCTRTVIVRPKKS